MVEMVDWHGGNNFLVEITSVGGVHLSFLFLISPLAQSLGCVVKWVPILFFLIIMPSFPYMSLPCPIAKGGNGLQTQPNLAQTNCVCPSNPLYTAPFISPQKPIYTKLQALLSASQPNPRSKTMVPNQFKTRRANDDLLLVLACYVMHLLLQTLLPNLQKLK